MVSIKSILILLIHVIVIKNAFAQTGFDTDWAQGTNSFRSGSGDFKWPIISTEQNTKIVFGEVFYWDFVFYDLSENASYPESARESITINLDSTGTISWQTFLIAPNTKNIV